MFMIILVFIGLKLRRWEPCVNTLWWKSSIPTVSISVMPMLFKKTNNFTMYSTRQLLFSTHRLTFSSELEVTPRLSVHKYPEWFPHNDALHQCCRKSPQNLHTHPFQRKEWNPSNDDFDQKGPWSKRPLARVNHLGYWPKGSLVKETLSTSKPLGLLTKRVLGQEDP